MNTISRYNVEVYDYSSSYFYWDKGSDDLLITQDVSPTQLNTYTGSDEDYLLAVF